MKWTVEYITDDSANVLIDDPTVKDPSDRELVGMGFPVKLAERLVRLHNESVETALFTLPTA